eukprot:2864634-Prymnesium_polylepis.1
MPGPSQPGGQLAGAASGRQTRHAAARSAAGPGRVTAPRLARRRRPARWSKDTSSNSNERLER